jgi:nucleoside-diphosphate kinase
LTVRDAPQVGEVISRFERKGFKLIGLKMHTATRGLAEEHYRDLSGKPFFKDLVDYIISGPVICMVRPPGAVSLFSRLVSSSCTKEVTSCVIACMMG